MKNIVNKIQAHLISEIMDKTPLEFANQLSHRLNNKLYFKREDTTPVHSFKLRGAYHKIRQLSDAQLACGVITSSAGNHAQGVALSAQKLGIKATIVMPKITPKIKIDAVRELGANIVLHGNNYDESYQFSQMEAKRTGQVFIHPFDDIDVIAGQATIAIELLEQLKKIDYIFIPVGGGGLISGIAAYVKHHQPSIKIIGVEPIESPALTRSMVEKKHIILEEVGLFADGVAVQQIGKESFRLATQLIDDTVLVSNDETCAAIKDVYDQTRSIVEPSGALSVAGAKRYIAQNKLYNKNIITILSGANVNFNRLRHIAERAEIGENKEMVFAATITEKAGSFLTFCQSLGNHTITEFNYRYSSKKEAYIFVGIALENPLEKQILLSRLEKTYKIVDMSDNEMAKTHIRYMVGGRKTIDNEIIYRFIFPEYPGALLKFLNNIGTNWNISLFHYRSHGADFGRVLVGFQVDNVKKLEQQLNQLKYQYYPESNNIAYQYFLS